MLSPSYTWYGGADIALEKDQEKEVTVDFTMNENTDMDAALVISMGAIAGTETSTSTIELSEFSLIRTE